MASAVELRVAAGGIAIDLGSRGAGECGVDLDVARLVGGDVIAGSVTGGEKAGNERERWSVCFHRFSLQPERSSPGAHIYVAQHCVAVSG